MIARPPAIRLARALLPEAMPALNAFRMEAKKDSTEARDRRVRLSRGLPALQPRGCRDPLHALKASETGFAVTQG